MRTILTVLSFSLLALIAGSGSAMAEITYPWCGQYGRDGRNCGFWTYAQCMAAISGTGGFCITNALYRGPSPGQILPPAGAPR
jgi:hypothetical protein